MKKKLLFVIDSLHSGGAEKSLVTLLNLLDYSKYEVDLLTFKEGGLYAPLLPNEVNRIESPRVFKEMEIPIPSLLKQREFNKVIWRMRMSLNIRYATKFTQISHGAQCMWPNLSKKIPKLEKGYDVAIAYSQGTPTYFVAEKVSAKKKLCWVNIDYKFAKYNRAFDENYYKQYDWIVGVSKKCTEVLIDVFPEFKSKIKIIYDIISEELVSKMSKNGKGFNDEFDGIRILTIGRLVYQKGYEYAIEAAKLLKEANINFKWYVIGEGGLKSDLESLVSKYALEQYFIFLGTYENPYPFIKDCDIYCQPSRFEGYGLAIAEARILNKPIVATNFDIVYDQIRHGENGLITSMDGEDVYKGIVCLIDNLTLKNNIVNTLSNEVVGTEKELKKIESLLTIKSNE